MKKVFIFALFLTVSLRGMGVGALERAYSPKVQKKVQKKVEIQKLLPLKIGSLVVQKRNEYIQNIYLGASAIAVGAILTGSYFTQSVS